LHNQFKKRIIRKQHAIFQHVFTIEKERKGGVGLEVEEGDYRRQYHHQQFLAPQNRTVSTFFQKSFCAASKNIFA
jgi:hypothetical protein